MSFLFTNIVRPFNGELKLFFFTKAFIRENSELAIRSLDCLLLMGAKYIKQNKAKKVKSSEILTTRKTISFLLTPDNQ